MSKWLYITKYVYPTKSYGNNILKIAFITIKGNYRHI